MNTNVAVTIDTTNVNVSVSAGSYEVTAIGVTGLKGDTGSTGPANTLSIGTVTTVAAGGSATASVTGTAPSQTLNLGLPTGATGSAATIAVNSTTTGAAGTSASVANVGTSSAASLNFTIPRGDTGTAATISTATPTTITGAAGTDASVANTGTTSNAVYQFTIPRGDTGATGATGTNGTNGTNGVDGKTLRNGSGTPSSGLGVDGDFYLDTTASRLYGPKASGAWGSGVSIIGATGADGKTVRNGTTTPSSGLGVDGDFYVNTSTNTISGPKTSGAWPTAVSLVGPTGSNGTAVRNGAGAPSSGLGVDGDFYIDTTASRLYGPKASGAWGSGVSLIGSTGAAGDWSTAQPNRLWSTRTTLTSADSGYLILVDSATAISVTSTTALTTGQRIDFLITNATVPSISAGTGATLDGTPKVSGFVKFRAQYSAATLICTSGASQSYVLVGDLAAA